MDITTKEESPVIPILDQTSEQITLKLPTGPEELTWEEFDAYYEKIDGHTVRVKPEQWKRTNDMFHFLNDHLTVILAAKYKASVQNAAKLGALMQTFREKFGATNEDFLSIAKGLVDNFDKELNKEQGAHDDHS